MKVTYKDEAVKNAKEVLDTYRKKFFKYPLAFVATFLVGIAVGIVLVLVA